MMDLENLTVEQIMAGYTVEDGGYVCLSCGARFEPGEVFPIGGRFFDAARAVALHVEQAHPERFQTLIGEGKYLSLTGNQKELFSLFYRGVPDAEIAKQLGVSASTVRHQRFIFRERAKAAKLYLAAWGMVEAHKNKRAELLPVHRGATMVDERYVITETEREKILQNVFESLEPLKLKVFSAKEKKKIVILREIAGQFEGNRTYSEGEVNDILGAIYGDHVTLRRYLIEYGYLDRTKDGASYWKK